MAKRSDLDYEKSIATLENRVSIRKLAANDVRRYNYYFEDLPQELNRYAFYVSGLEKLRTIESVRLSLVRAIEKGQTFEQWRNELDVDSFKKLSKARQELVFRTNLNNAYNQGTRHAAFENKDVTPYLMYDAVNDSRVRPTHLELDGTIRPVEDSFWDVNTPPIGFNCRCALVSLSKENAAEMRKEQGKSGFITSKQEIDAAKKRGGKPDKGFEKSQKLGQFSKNIKALSLEAAEKLPRNSPYKKRFKEQIEQVDRKVALWWESVKNNFIR